MTTLSLQINVFRAKNLLINRAKNLLEIELLYLLNRCNDVLKKWVSSLINCSYKYYKMSLFEHFFDFFTKQHFLYRYSNYTLISKSHFTVQKPYFEKWVNTLTISYYNYSNFTQKLGQYFNYFLLYILQLWHFFLTLHLIYACMHVGSYRNLLDTMMSCDRMTKEKIENKKIKKIKFSRTCMHTHERTHMRAGGFSKSNKKLMQKIILLVKPNQAHFKTISLNQRNNSQIKHRICPQTSITTSKLRQKTLGDTLYR